MLMRALASVVLLVLLSSCAHLEPPRAATSGTTLVGAWEVTVSRSRGVGKNLLTFSSDGTFFRSGDTHTLLSGAHGAWKLVSPNVYEASYVAFSFDATGKWTGINRNNLQLTLGPNGNEFKGNVKASIRDLEDKELRTGSSPLTGKRIQVQPF